VWRIGDAVLKQCRDLQEGAFIATLSEALPMVADPVRAEDGNWVHSGWAATRWIDAPPDPNRWDEVLTVGDELHTALAALEPEWPGALDVRRTPWAIADRVAWQESPVPPDVRGEALAIVSEALGLLDPDDQRPVQVIHGDLAGNVLFPAHGSPVVIDLSPYRRPAAFSTAIAVVDQICWHGSPATRAELVDASDLARAVVFRVVAAALHSADAGDIEATRARPLVSSRRSPGG
jgi:uncharacterized protein (TIGR02569 family)